LDQLITDSLRDLSLVPTLSVWDLVFALIVSAVLCMILAKIYIYTHSGHSYSRSFVHTQVFVGITIALIMLIIGSNIARAFALVGALSIIRFRNPVKDSRDVAFIFMSMAVGMAAGTKFYFFATIFTATISLIAVFFHVFRFGEAGVSFYVLRVRMNSQLRDQIEQVFAELCSTHSVISVDRMAGMGDADDYIYEINLKRNITYDNVVDQVSRISNDISVSLLVGEASVNV